MLLNPYKFVREEKYLPFNSKTVFKEAGIEKVKRVFYVLREKPQIQTPDNFFSRYENISIIQINYAVYKGNSYSSKITSDFTVVKSVYIYNSFYDINTGFSFKDLTLSLTNASTSAFGLFDDSDYIDYGITLTATHENCPTILNINDLDIDTIENENNLPMCDPRYYNEKHYELVTGEIFANLISSLSNNDTFIYSEQLSIKAEELIDEYTEIYMVKDNDRSFKFKDSQVDMADKTLMLNKSEKTMKVTEQLIYSYETILKLFPITVSAMLEGFCGIYDTNLGVNFKNLRYKNNFFNKKKQLNDINILKDNLINIGNMLSEKFGKIRLLSYTSDISDIIRIIFEENEIKQLTISTSKSETYDRAMTALNNEYYNNVMVDYYSGKHKHWRVS